MEARLKSGIWVKALIRRCDLAAIGVAVLARGDADAGAILLKLSGRDSLSTVLAQARGPDGALVWTRELSLCRQLSTVNKRISEALTIRGIAPFSIGKQRRGGNKLFTDLR